MNHNEIDERHDLAHVGDRAANVHRAQCAENASDLGNLGCLAMLPASNLPSFTCFVQVRRLSRLPC